MESIAGKSSYIFLTNLNQMDKILFYLLTYVLNKNLCHVKKMGIDTEAC